MKVPIKRIFLILCTLATTYSAIAQQDPMFTQYQFNTLIVNPAYAGSRDALSIVGISRWQWVGIDGAPITHSITAHAPVKENLGIGGSLYYDKIGPTNQLLFFADFAYKLSLSKKTKLVLGIKGGVHSIRNNLTSLEVNDPNFNFNQSELLPNVGVGAYLHQERFYIGLSAPKLLENNLSSGGDDAQQLRHYFLIAGFVKDLSENIKFKPTILTRYVPNTPLVVDLSANFLFWDKLWLGANYRTRDAIGLVTQFQFTEKLRAGYAYEYPLSSLSNATEISFCLLYTSDAADD